VLDGRTVVFLSCMDLFKVSLARPIRDKLNNLGYRAIIVMDEPNLRGTFTAEDKVNAYIEASDAFVALCTSDKRVPGGTAQNVTDEIARARTHPRLRDVVFILKEESVNLPSNIDPVWDALDPQNPNAAYGVIQRQLHAWGVIPSDQRPSVSSIQPLPAGYLERLFDGVQNGEPEKAEDRIRALFARTSKESQHRVARGIYEYIIDPPEGAKDVHVVTSFLEACSRLDPAIVKIEWVEHLVGSPVVQHRMCAALILWGLAETHAGVVPLDFVAKLAKPSIEDWYVYSPALGAAKQLALTRMSALQIIVDLGSSLNPDDRDAAVSAWEDLARVDANVVPLDSVERLSKDSDPSICERAESLLLRLKAIPEDDRRWSYGKFGL
jgi:hypothetical protein